MHDQWGGSRDSGTRYSARDGKVYAKPPGESEREAGSALTANGRELERFESALQRARAQRTWDPERNAKQALKIREEK